MVTARIHSDDYLFETTFDATDWLIQATESDIIQLAKEDWKACQTSDNIAYFARQTGSYLDELLTHCESLTDIGEDCGFWCDIDQQEARDWLSRNRPDIAAKLPNPDE